METLTKTVWKVDSMHSEVQFKVKHLVISTVTGFFNSFDGTIETDEDNLDGATAKFKVDVNSINTNVKDRDEHLKSADFFDAENYPNLVFDGKLKHVEGSDYKLIGDLTIKNTTKQVTLDVEHGGFMTDGYGQHKAGFEINGKINRKEFGLNWSQVTEAGGVVVGDTVRLNLNIQVAKK